MDLISLAVVNDEFRTGIVSELEPARFEVADEVSVEGKSPAAVVAAAPDRPDGVEQMKARYGRRWHIRPPLVLVCGDDDCAYERTEAMDAGAADMLLWPSQRDLLVPLLRRLVAMRRQYLHLHPLTGLPAGPALRRALQKQSCQEYESAVVAFDIRAFKAFNDCYGFVRGDRVLKFTADLLVRISGPEGDVYHIGGDDFFVTTPSACADEIAATALDEFDDGIRQFYDADELNNGGLRAVRRGGHRERKFPIMSLIAACVTGRQDTWSTVEQLASLLADYKQQVKKADNGRYVRDGRIIGKI